MHSFFVFQHNCPPVVAYHIGSLGFLTCFKFPNYKQDLTSVVNGKYSRFFYLFSVFSPCISYSLLTLFYRLPFFSHFEVSIFISSNLSVFFSTPLFRLSFLYSSPPFYHRDLWFHGHFYTRNTRKWQTYSTQEIAMWTDVQTRNWGQESSRRRQHNVLHSML